MPDPILAPEDEGFFSWLSRPRRVVTNAISGDLDAAADQALDFIFNVPDALIPGDAIPEFSGPETDVEVGDLLGMEPGWQKTAVDVVGGIPLDPVSYVPGGKIVQSLAKPVGAGIRALGGGKVLDKGRNLIADTMNWHRLTPEQLALETQAKAAGNIASRASEVEAQRILKGMAEPERQAVFDAIQNVAPDEAGETFRRLTNRVSGVAQPLVDNQAEAILSLQAHPAYQAASPARRAVMEQAARDSVALGQTQADEFLAGAQVGPRQPGQPGTGASVGPYLQRTFDFEDLQSPVVRPGSGAAQATRARSLTSDVELEQALNADPLLRQAYQRDLAPALLRRAEQQGKIATRKTLGDNLYGQGFDITNKAHRDDVIAKLDKMIEANGADRDFAVRAKTMFVGMKPLDPISDAVAKFNRNFFKPAATVGVVVPRVSFTVRNSLSSIVQALSTPGAREAALRDPRWIYQRTVGGIADIVDEFANKAFGKRIPALDDATNQLLARVEEAYAHAGGSVEKVKNYLRTSQSPMAKEALEAVEQNILENPIRVDEVISAMRPDAPMWQQVAKNVWDLPSELNRHVEDRIRAGLFVAGRKAGKDAASAAKQTRDAVLDYSVPTIENRRMRTWIPFGAFMSQSLPQSGKLLLENLPEGGVSGAIAGGTARGLTTQMFESDPEAPIYPDMEGKMAIPVDPDLQGNPQYLTSLGLPLEGLGDIPLGTDQREFERFLGVATNPLVKTAYSAISGRDPYFGTPYGGYDKPNALLEAAGLERGPVAGGIRKALGTGLLQPAAHVLNLAEPWLDERQGPALDLLRAGTGMRVRSVDEDMALRLQMEEALRQNPQVKQYSGLYAGSDDEETAALLADYSRVKRTIQEKRKAAKEEAAKVQ